MKKTLVILFAIFGLNAMAQKFAFVDYEYLTKNIPAYESANQQLEQISKKWQQEISALNNEAQAMYKDYQANMVYLSDSQKQEREQAIVDKETQARELKQKYFGPEGELFKKKESLLKPIQDEIYTALKELSEKKGYAAIWDRATGAVLFVNPNMVDISDDILNQLGYAK